MQKTTKIDVILNKETENPTLDEEEKERLLSETEIGKTITNLSLPQDFRIYAMERFNETHSLEETLEFVTKICLMYQFSGTILLQKYLYALCTESNISDILKTTAVKSLCSFDDEAGYKALVFIFPGLDIPIQLKIELNLILMKNETYKTQARDYFCEIINNKNIQDDFRYKIILSIERQDNIKEENRDFFITEACVAFIQENNSIRYRILACQNLLKRNVHTDLAEQTLLLFIEDVELDENVRADAADVLLNLGKTDDAMNAARDAIIALGGKSVTIFDNKQNVHVKEVEESTNKIIEFLYQRPVLRFEGSLITFEYVKKKIKDIIKTEREELKIPEDAEYERGDRMTLALNRINMDRALYSKYSCSLVSILLRVWTYMVKHEESEEIQKRLLQELEEMSGTCSSGYATRLVNTISGFGDCSIRISWRDQIIGNVTGRLNAKIRTITDKKYKENILTEMTLNSRDFASRANFLRFLRENMLGIREEMYEEFKDYMDDATFDLYFRFAISKYESGDFV